MKKIIFIAAILACFKSFSQNVAINTTGSAANASAMLDVSATNKGMLIPRMTSTEREAISNPANGLIVFDLSTNTFWYFSTIWKELNNNNGGSGFTLPYAGSGANPAKLFGIANTDLTSGATSIYGRAGSTPGSFTTSYTVGVWGENTQNGVGLLGTSNGSYGIIGRSEGNGAGVWGTTTNALGFGIRAEVNNPCAAAIGGDNWGSDGNAANFQLLGTTNNSDAVYMYTQGTGRAMYATINNQNSTAEAMAVSSNGLGRGFNVWMQNANNTEPGIRVMNDGKGDGLEIYNNNTGSTFNYLLQGINNGLGGGINLSINNANTNYDGIQVVNKGTGRGIFARSDKGSAGIFSNNNSLNTADALSASNYGTASAGSFSIFNTNNTVAALEATTNGSGPGLLVDNTHGGLVFSLATFKSSGISKARIDGSGKGFFNGGTQNSGADLAEAFDVTGSLMDYEMGDVLIISQDKDRTVERSAGAYSTLVAGVYATKPGVLLTEESIDSDISDKVPMGVVGVIPTKVCLEGGEIKRGDLLVTSSIPGVAMKADIEKVKPGMVIGKALENYNSSATGKIKVLVNVK